jgi:hypothetical protein
MVTYREPTDKDIKRAEAATAAAMHDPSYVTGLEYDAGRDMIELRFRSGGEISIPRRAVPGLEKLPLPGRLRFRRIMKPCPAARSMSTSTSPV